MKNPLSQIKKFVQGKLTRKANNRNLRFFETGFHGDLYLIELVDILMQQCQAFVETGSNVGSTLAFVAKKYPNISCLSCEPDKEAYQQAQFNTRPCRNVSLFNEMSQEFINRIIHDDNLLSQDILFWLDAHGHGFDWPLREELKLITSSLKKAYILIDDFLIPGLDCFGYDQYQDHICSFEYIKDSINKNCSFHLYYPCYTEKTSPHHPLRGWGLIEFGNNKPLVISNLLKNKIKQIQ